MTKPKTTTTKVKTLSEPARTHAAPHPEQHKAPDRDERASPRIDEGHLLNIEKRLRDLPDTADGHVGKARMALRNAAMWMRMYWEATK